jgi:TIR domain
VADIFVSYTSSDQAWAFWIGHELSTLGHEPHIHEWEVRGGDNIMAWMQERFDNAHHVMCIFSKKYLVASYSAWERDAAQWAAASGLRNFFLPVLIESCDVPRLVAPFKHCDLIGVREEEVAKARLRAFLAPPERSPPGPFPGQTAVSADDRLHRRPPPFAGAASKDAVVEIKKLFGDIHQAIGEEK